MDFKLIPLREEHIKAFKTEMREAFQQGAIDSFGQMEEEILPESHIDHSLSTTGAVAYEAVAEGKRVGGAIVVIDAETRQNHLDFLYVKNGAHSKGIGQAIWNALERRYPKTMVWETSTPYFEKRNIHFYVNRCGFHIVEFFNRKHPAPYEPALEDPPQNDYFEGMFRFEKVMKQKNTP